jgi:hypothetical protein
VWLWHGEKVEAIGSLEGHRDGLRSIVFSPDGIDNTSGSWDNLTRTDCMDDIIVRFSGREIPEGLSPAKRRKFIDSILNDPKVKHRFVFRQWPLIPDLIIKPGISRQCKRAPNRLGRWGSTLFDFFNVPQVADLEFQWHITTGSILLNDTYEELNAMAKDCIAWAEKEKGPELIPVYNIAKLIKDLENSAFSDQPDEDEDRMQEDTDLDTKKKHDEALTLPQPVSHQRSIDH